MTFDEWLLHTQRLQTLSFRVDPAVLEGDAFTDYVRHNVLAAQVELGEFIQELPWKPWKLDTGRPNAEARARAVEELVDVLHFIANLLVVLRVPADELERVYGHKQGVNRKRQQTLKEASAR